jgi:hypothetical protein
VNTGGETPAWQQKLKQDVGENPARFLDRRIPNPPPRNSMFRARLEGIDRLAVIGAWKATERRLAHEADREPREHVMRLLAERRDWLLEHGERPRDFATQYPHELPERYQPQKRDRPVPEKDVYWVKRDREGELVERRPWSERPTSHSTTSRFERVTQQAATGGGGGDS